MLGLMLHGQVQLIHIGVAVTAVTAIILHFFFRYSYFLTHLNALRLNKTQIEVCGFCYVL